MIKALTGAKILDNFRFDGAFRIAVVGVCFASFDRPHCEHTDEHGKPRSSDDEFKKQDCELKAFYRLAASLKEHYPRLPICLLLDGLYCNQNVLSICEKNQWDYFITLQDNSVPAIQKKIQADLNAHQENRLHRQNKEVAQDYSWTNPIPHTFWNNWKK